MNGEGIMNLPAGVGGATSQDGLDSFAPLIASQQAARDMGYPRFTRELLAAGSEIDPAEVQEFLQAIRDAGLTADDVALMRRVVEAVFNDPNNYPEVRQTLIQEGVPEDLLPETFDLEFFTALRMAVEEAENLAREPRPMDQAMPMPMEGAPVEMAEGGIVGLPELKPIARAMASMGRQGDTMLAHITPQEAMMLKRMGGSGSINPYTGLPEFFLGKIVKGIGKAISSVGKAVKKFASSTVGRAVTAVALGAFLGPAAAGFLGKAGFTFATSAVGTAAITGAIGGFGSSILAGDGIKNALRSGLTGAVLAGGITGITGGAQAFAGRPEMVSAYNQQGGFLGTVRQTARNYFGAPVDTARQIYGAPETAAPAGSTPIGAERPISPVGTAAQTPIETGSLTGAPEYRFGVQPSSAPTTTDIALGRAPTTPMPTTDTQFMRAIAETPASSITGTNLNAPLQPPGLVDRFTQGAKDIYSEYLSPSRASIQGRSTETIFNELTTPIDQGGKFGLARTPQTFEAAQQLAAKEAPGMVRRLAPLALAGTAATEVLTGGGVSKALGGAFKAPEQQPGETLEAYNARIEADLQEWKSRPENRTFYSGFQTPTFNVYSASRGSGPQGVENFPRKNGHISGPGTGTSDDIPAMLSDGEFVFTAKAVRNMGNGSRRKGAAKMYKLMKMLEGGPVGKVG